MPEIKVNRILTAGFIIWLAFQTQPPCNAQTLAVENVTFQDNGNTVIVNYDLLGDSLKKYDISLWLSYNKGATFPFKLKGISGDAGNKVSAGTGKGIIWEVSADFPEGLQGENFVFAVEARVYRPPLIWPYYAATAGVVGGFVYLSTRKHKKPPPTVGVISITVPGDILD